MFTIVVSMTIVITTHFVKIHLNAKINSSLIG